MERLTNNQGYLIKCKGYIEESNCYSDTSCNHIFYALNKLKEYEDLEEQGLLLKLPCKVGDTVYSIYVNNKKPRKCVVEAIYCGAYGTDNKWHIKIDGFHYDFSVIGNTVFLTQAEAEEELKKIESED